MWPLHVKLCIVQSIMMAYVQFYLPLFHWSLMNILEFMSQDMAMLLKTRNGVKALRFMKMDQVCSTMMHGGS